MDQKKKKNVIKVIAMSLVVFDLILFNLIMWTRYYYTKINSSDILTYNIFVNMSSLIFLLNLRRIFWSKSTEDDVETSERKNKWWKNLLLSLDSSLAFALTFPLYRYASGFWEAFAVILMFFVINTLLDQVLSGAFDELKDYL